MLIITNFTQGGIPKTGLTPTLDIWESDGTQVVTSQTMTEIAGGFYKYDFTTYDEDEDYCIRADGTSTLNNNERYTFATNETAGVGKILQIEKGKWEIKGNQMIFYAADGTTPIYTHNLTNKSGTPTEKDVYARTPV